MKNNYNCIIIDDEPKAIELLMECLKSLYSNLSVIGTFTLWREALPALRDVACDILFIDISMPGKSGLDLLALVPGLECEIIFITAHSEFALSAFKFAPTGYILKPFDDRDLITAIDKAIERIRYKKLAHQASGAALESKIGVPNNKGIDYLNLHDIVYLEGLNSCTKVVTGETEVVSSYSLGRFKVIVEPHSFYQVHRSYIVNLNCVKRYTVNGTLVMLNGHEVPVSKTIREEFLLIFNKVSKNN